MECVLNCGIQSGETLGLSPAQHLVSISMCYGKENVKVDVKPTATITGLKNLLYSVLVQPLLDG